MTSTAKLSLEKRVSRKQFFAELEKQKNVEDSWARTTPGILSQYLQMVHKVCVPDDFPKQLLEKHRKCYFYQKGFYFHYSIIDAIVESCELWLNYLQSKEDFDKLVCQEVLSMTEIHSSVIAGRHFGVRNDITLKKEPPYTFTTIVNSTGGITVYP